MVKSKLRYYTYKTTFKDLPKYFYYGKHKDSGKSYFGSPETWRHLWDQFEPEMQILCWYETEEECRVSEKKIIDATWRNKYSLNEHNSVAFSEEVCRRNGKRSVEVGSGVHSPKLRKENSERGKKIAEEGKGFHNLGYRESENYKRVLSDNGKKSAEKALEEERGIYSAEYRESDRYKKNQSNNGRKSGGKNKIPIVCLETGVVYPSAHEAHRKTGVSRSNISSCCAGKRKNAGGYHWQYFK